MIAATPRSYLFDLDGVLVRTEELHQEAYRDACARHGFTLDWTFERYCRAAHYGPERLQTELRQAFPHLFEQVSWQRLYELKSRIYLALLATAEVRMQPGAEMTLRALTMRGAPVAVVTNSTREQVELLCRRQPVLGALVRVWVSRGDYVAAKPAPDAYLTALARLNVAAEDAIGFEDTPRGLQALAAASVKPVLVTTVEYSDLGGVAPVLRIGSLAELPEAWL